MSRTQRILALLRSELTALLPTISRTTCCKTVEIEDGPDGTFFLVAKWLEQDGEHQHRIHYTREYVLGPYLKQPRPIAKMSACGFRVEAAREIQRVRMASVYTPTT